MEGFYSKPRVDRELLATYAEGIVVSSACLAGEVAQHLMAGEYDKAKEAAAWYANLFKDRYYLEVQAHDSDGQAALNEQIFRLGDDLGLPVLATNDAHFLKATDHDAHDVLLCIGLGKDRSDADRMRYDAGLYFKSAPEISARFPGRPDVLENTLRIADEVSVEFGKKYHVPSFPLPGGVATENELLVRLATGGAEARYGDPLPDNVRQRLDYELGVITSTGYAGTSSSLRISSRRRATAAFPSGRVAVRRLARLSPTRCGSPTSAHSGSICCSSASSIQSACRCRTSTSTSVSSGVAR
jgi:DNA polymerase-3 subunit alpha